MFVDSSASMGVGERGKLQLAAEVAAGIAALALRLGARVGIASTCGRSMGLVRKDSFGELLAFLESFEARGAELRSAGRFLTERARGAGRVVVLSDLLGFHAQDLLGLLRPGRDVEVIQILAPKELAPDLRGPVDWVDPENGERVRIELGPERVEAYGEALSVLLEGWGRHLRRHRIGYGVWSSETKFEDVLAGGLF